MITYAVEKKDLRQLCRGFRGEIRFDEPMSRHTSLGIGGPADLLAVPQVEADVSLLISRIHGEGFPVMVLGAGSNLLVKDGGIKGVAIKLSKFKRISDVDGGLWADAGVPLPALIKHGVARGIQGFEYLYGIPGTVGGAVVMNAGTHEGETGPLVQEVHLLTFKGERLILKGEELAFDYRTCRLPRGIVLGVLFRCRPGDRKKIEEKIQTYKARRSATQPLNFPNVGSIFKNPPGNFAGRLVEQAGLKGTRIGQAQISEKHGNFIVNCGGATAEDVIRLIKLAGKRIQSDRGIHLELEVRIIGRDEK